MTFFALRALLARVPGVVWVGLTVAAFLGAAAVGLVKHGERTGRLEVTRAARADSTVRQVATVDTATKAADVAIDSARTAKQRADSGRVVARKLERSAMPLLEDAPPAIQLLVSAQSSALDRDSIAIAAAHVAIGDLLLERSARVELDSLRVRSQGDGAAPGSRKRDMAIGAGAAVVMVAGLLLYFGAR